MATDILKRFLRVGLLLATVVLLGRVYAAEGGVSEASPSVLTNAIFWLDAADASTLTLEGGNVLQWKSKTPDQRTATWSGAKPVYDTTTWGIPTVDFGAAGSGRNMTYTRVTGIRTIFCVIKMAKSGSIHLLGDSGYYSFHRGSNGAYLRTDLDQVAGTVVWDGRKSVAPATDIVPDDSFRVICATRSSGGNSDCLAKDRNYNDRTGGKQYSELIVFDTVLSDADRIAVTDYLIAKWGALAAATAPDLISTALLRYDASRRANFTFDGDGKVTGWTNLGAGGTDYDAFVPTSKRSGAANYYQKGTLEFQNDVPVFQMGAVGSAIDLGFKNITTARTVFEVADIAKNWLAFFLGWDGSQVYDFHTGGVVDSPTYGHTQHGLLNGNTQIFADGVWTATTSLRPDGLHLFSIDLRANGSANRLATDRDFAGGGQIGKDGGKALSELLVFERELSDIERVAVELALKAKWTEGVGWLDGSDLALFRSASGVWSETGAWMQQGVACNWADGQIAVFDGVDAAVTVAANVTTPQLYFRASATLSGSATVTLGDAPAIYVAEGAEVRISAPLVAGAKIRKLGKGRLVFTAEQPGVPGVEVVDGTFAQVTPFVATWEGNGDRANVNDPLNWTCTDAGGNPIPDGVPTAEHEILLAGRTTFNVPPGQTLAYKTLTMSSVTLEADCDWRGLGPIALADGMTVNTAGHTLRLATLTSETTAGATITDTVGGGVLHVDVPTGVTVTNDRVRVSGSLAFVKDGEGTFVASLAGQTYTGGNDIVAGTFVVNGEQNRTQALGYYGNGDTSPDWVTTVRSNAVFDIAGCPNHCNHGLVLDGGTLVSSRPPRNAPDPTTGLNGADWLKDIRLTADSTIRATRSFGLVAGGYAAATIDLAGHTLTLDIASGETYWLANTTLTEGRVIVTGGGCLQFGGNLGGYAVSAPDTAFAFRDCSIRLKCSPEIGDYVNEADTAVEVVEGNATFRVHGTWWPSAAWHSAILLPGATLDLSNRTGTWTNACTIDDATRQLAFVPESQITVNLAGREDLVNGLRVVDFGPVPPTRMAFVPDATTLERFMLAEDAQGLVLSAPVITARWTGEGNDGSLSNSANWDCRDAVGEVVPDALPGGATAVTISGPVGFDMADASTFRYRSLAINVTLTRDCDWTALGDIPFPEGARIDLNRHRFTVSDLKGSGTICSSCTLNRETPVPEIVRTSANFWLDAADASTLTVDAAGVVTKWTSKDVNRIEAIGVNGPTYSETTWGRPTVDFGAVGSNKDMSYSQRTIRTAFWVIRIDPKGYAPLLGDSGSNYHFHRGPNGEYAHSSFNYTARTWNGLEEVSPTEDAIPSATFQVIAETMSVDAKASLLTKDRNYADRSGGRQLSELICFPGVLSDADREAVVRYLQAKWMGACTTGELCINVPEGKEVVNASVALEGNLKVVKEGAGRFVTGRQGQTYLGGNDVRAGEFKFSDKGNSGIYGNANENLDWVTTVRSNATLVVDGWGCHRHPIVLDGGHLDCRTPSRGGDMISTLRLTADSTMEAWDYGLCAPGYAESTIDLAGHTLTATIGVEYRPGVYYYRLFLYNTRMTAGTFLVDSLGFLEVNYTALNAPETCLDLGGAMLVYGNSGFSMKVRDYVCNNSNGWNLPNSANTPIQVVNRFTPIGSTFYHVRMLDGSTLDLSRQAEAMNVVSSENCVLTYAPNAKVTVDVGNRKVRGGERLLAWEAIPEGITFSSVPSADFKLQMKDDGLYVLRGLFIIVR